MKLDTEVINQILSIVRDPNQIAEAVYNMVRDIVRNESSKKFMVTVLVIAIKKHPDMIEHLRELNNILGKVIERYG